MRPFQQKSRFKFSVGLTAIFCLAFAGSCGKTTKQADSDSIRTNIVSTTTPSVFHAGNDIAMIVMSLCDALKVGEPFDATAYNMEAVLTDGMGRPLYIDKNTNPGMWEIKVIDQSHAEIHNLDDGDLTTSDLIDYITGCLNLSADNRLSERRGGDEEKVVYEIQSGTLTFVGPGDDGLSGCRVIIHIQGDK